MEKCGFSRTPGLNIKDDRYRSDRRAPLMLGGSRFSGASRSGDFKRNESRPKGLGLAEKVQRELKKSHPPPRQNESRRQRN